MPDANPILCETVRLSPHLHGQVKYCEEKGFNHSKQLRLFCLPCHSLKGAGDSNVSKGE
jgi:hypothetical protein